MAANPPVKEKSKTEVKTTSTSVPVGNNKLVNNKLILKIVLIILLFVFSSLVLLFFGYWYGFRKAQQTNLSKTAGEQETVQEKKSVQEVPHGDEDLETDEEYQRALEEYDDQGCTGESCSWMTYQDEIHGFSFQYPSTVFLEKTDGYNLPLVFLDTELIIIPEAYGGFLTPVEFNHRGDETFEEVLTRIKGNEDLFYPNTFKEEEFSSPVKGIRVSGVCQSFPCDGQKHHMVFLDGPRGLININFTPTEQFTENLFDKILATVKFL